MEYDSSEWLRAERSKSHGLMLQIARGLAKGRYESLVASSESCLAGMDDSDPDIRQASILLGEDYWRLGQDHRCAERWLQIAMSDHSRDCRTAAINALRSTFSDSGERRVLAVLARIVIDCQEVVPIRNAAYIALCEVQDGPSMEHAMLDPLEQLALVSVDWARVEALAEL
jgi:hypothetical protein